jgi:hypothetical protein
MQTRGFLPDGMDKTSIVLVKACSRLRLTYELKLATFMAQENKAQLIISISNRCQLEPTLEKFLAEHRVTVMKQKT